jgi:hypothetical protein
MAILTTNGVFDYHYDVDQATGAAVARSRHSLRGAEMKKQDFRKLLGG